MRKKIGKRRVNWRVQLGIGLTATWIFLGLVYLIGEVGVNAFVNLPTGEIGSFLEGAFAPLAFLWLVIGHFMQQSEIAANTEAIQNQEQSARRQELHSRRNGYFKLLNLVQDQLGSIAGFHYISITGPTGTQEVSSEEYQKMRAEAAAGDHSLFIRKMVSLAAVNRQNQEQVNALFLGTEIRARHTDNFYMTFHKLLKSARDVDEDKLVENALLYGAPAGMLYRIIQHVKGEKSIDGSIFATMQGLSNNDVQQNED